MSATSSTSSHTLTSKDIKEVYSACKEISSIWKELGTHLGLKPSTIEIIKEDCRNTSCTEALRKLLEAWLKRDSLSQPLPSWKTLSQAVQEVDLSLSLSIAGQHSCGCCVCTNSPPSESSPVALLKPHYESIYSRLASVDSVAEYLNHEDIITTDQLETIVKSTDNKREWLFTILESVIAIKGSTLIVFATALQQHIDTGSIGLRLFQQCREHSILPDVTSETSTTKEVLVNVDAKYRHEFNKMRGKLGVLCCAILTLLLERSIAVSMLKSMLGLACPELKVYLEPCQNIEEVIRDVIRPRTTLMRCDYLETIFECYDLQTDPLDTYKKAVNKFLQTMKLEHSYGQVLMDEFHSHISKPESITFILNWQAKDHLYLEYFLQDLEDLFQELVADTYTKYIKVKVVFPTNSIEVQCFVPAHLQSPIIKSILENEKVLNTKRVVSVKAGSVAVFISMSKQHNVLPAPSKRLPTEEDQYTDVFQQYFADGLALKKEVEEKLQKVKGVQSLGIGFSNEKPGYWPVIRIMPDETTYKEIKQRGKRKSDLVHKVTTALHDILIQLYTTSWSLEELENLIEVVINYPLKVFNLCTAGETITTIYSFSANQRATQIGCMSFSVRHCLTVGEIKRVAHYHIGAFHTVIPSRNSDYCQVMMDPLPVNEAQQTQVQYEMVHEPVAQVTLTQPGPQEDPSLIYTALKATFYPDSADRGLDLVKRGNFAYTSTQQAHGPLEFLHGKMALVKQEVTLVDGKPVPKYKYVLVTPNSPMLPPSSADQHPVSVYFRHQCNVDISVLRNTTAAGQQNNCDLESLLSNLEAGEGVRLPSKIKWYKPPEKAEFKDMKGTVVFVKDGVVHKLADRLSQVYSMGYPCCQWNEDGISAATVPGVSGAPVFLQRGDEFHLIGILITEQSATPVEFALKIMHPRIALHHVDEINDYELNDLLEKYKEKLREHERDQLLLPPKARTLQELQGFGEGTITSSLEVCIQPH